ncbi:UNVERIFIED_CONTAM: hypothetical protein GTU68_035372 [Idotea baltica]|nr:hypothetical protein [Idotea baltica]
MRLIPSPPIAYDTGTVNFSTQDVDLISLAPAEARSLRGKEIAMIFQEPMTSLNPLKRCGEQVAEALREHCSMSETEIRTEVISLFDRVRLPDPGRIYDSYPHQLSGGQKQRVMIAMAISCKPKLLIADEPTTALDVTVQREIIELIQELQHETGMAMIFISHDLGVVSRIADNILVMHQGCIVESGTAHQVMHSPQDVYTKGLLSSRPPSKQRPKKLRTEPILQVRNIHTWYPVRSGIFNKVTAHVKAVNGVSLSLYPGETLGVVGESGCGKSTLGRSIVGLEKIREGEVLYKGQSYAGMSKLQQQAMLREVQMIFQDPYSSLNPRMPVGEAILEPMTVHGILDSKAERKEEVLRLLEKVGLDKSAFDRAPHEFSGGQRQRICIARTLGLRPEVIICDESVSALDVSVQAQVLNLLNDLKAEYGLSYIFISHDLSVVRYMSDKVVVMQGGEILEYEEADMLYTSPKTAYTRSLIESTYD